MKTKLIGLPSGVKKVMTFRPHAYCIAKPENWCAVFACPPQNSDTTGVPFFQSMLVQGNSVADVKAGDWMSLAYVRFSVSGDTVAVPYQPEFKLRTK